MNAIRRSAVLMLLSIPLLVGLYPAAGDPPRKEEAPVSKALCISGEVRSARLHKNNVWMEIEVLMTLRFKNLSANPVLVFVNEDYPWLGGKTLSNTKEEALSKNFVFVSGLWLSSDPPAWKETISKLDQKIPPSGLIRTIAPGTEWSFDKTVVLGIEIKGSFNQRSKPWDEIKKSDPLWLQLEFQLWPSNLEEDSSNPIFGKQLQQRWKDHGQLILEDITSEPIPLSLPAS